MSFVLAVAIAIETRSRRNARICALAVLRAPSDDNGGIFLVRRGSNGSSGRCVRDGSMVRWLRVDALVMGCIKKDCVC